jgi:hypothetical protein
MKKIMLFFSLATLVCANFVSCGLIYRDGGVHLYIANGTEQTLKLKFPLLNKKIQNYSETDKYDYKIYVVEPGMNEQIDAYKIPYGTEYRFEDYFKKCADVYGEDVSWQILSEDDVVLKVWNYADVGQIDLRFFEETAWGPAGFVGDRGILVYEFEILTEDIEQ